MCYAVYMGVDIELTASKFDEKSPGFYIEFIEGKNKENDVRKQFTKRFIYYLGSHEGCGCGFSYDEDSDEKERIEASKKDVLQFNKLLQDVLQKSAECEIFLCWEGNQGKAPIKSEVVGVEIFSKGDWVQEEPTFYKLRN